jgi:hypothetical protein
MKKNALRVDRRDESAQELLPGHRYVRDRPPVRVDGLSAEGPVVSLHRAIRRHDAVRDHTGLQRVTGDDRRHVDEHRQVHVVHLHDVQKRLLLSRVRDGRAVVESVHLDRARADAAAACLQDRRQDQAESVHMFASLRPPSSCGISENRRGHRRGGFPRPVVVSTYRRRKCGRRGRPCGLGARALAPHGPAADMGGTRCGGDRQACVAMASLKRIGPGPAERPGRYTPAMGA